MLTSEEIRKIKIEAHRKGIDVGRAVENYKMIKRNPNDLLQPGDRDFERIWGKKYREQEYRAKRDKEDKEMRHREIMEFKNRPIGNKRRVI